MKASPEFVGGVGWRHKWRWLAAQMALVGGTNGAGWRHEMALVASPEFLDQPLLESRQLGVAAGQYDVAVRRALPVPASILTPTSAILPPTNAPSPPTNAI